MNLTKALTTIGKPGVQVAAITRRPDGYYIVHVGAKSAAGNQPTVNGEPVDVHARKLSSEDMIDLAGTKLQFVLVDQ